MQLIAAVDRNWAIGRNGQMLATIPADQKMFRQETMGKVVVMGRKTLESLPGGRPLEGRINIILTKTALKVRGAVICHNLEEVFQKLLELKAAESVKEEDIYIIGGQSIYEQFLPYCDNALITYIDYDYEADTYMVNLEKEGWVLKEAGDEQTFFDLCYEFRRYEKSGGV